MAAGFPFKYTVAVGLVAGIDLPEEYGNVPVPQTFGQLHAR
jgi:hypothetical protein